jgi:branched-chain amino acid transport system substrate-binding protein
MSYKAKSHRLPTIVAAALIAIAGSALAQDIKFGFNADQSGTAAAELGMAARHGFELAIDDINQ